MRTRKAAPTSSTPSLNTAISTILAALLAESGEIGKLEGRLHKAVKKEEKFLFGGSIPKGKSREDEDDILDPRDEEPEEEEAPSPVETGGYDRSKEEKLLAEAATLGIKSEGLKEALDAVKESLTSVCQKHLNQARPFCTKVPKDLTIEFFLKAEFDPGEYPGMIKGYKGVGVLGATIWKLQWIAANC